MASPFKKKSPLNAYKYSLTSQYANPKGVIQPIVEAEAAKAIGDASKKVLGVYSKIEADKKAKIASNEAGDLKHQRAMEVKWGKGNTGPAVKPASHEENMSNLGLKSYKNTQVEDFMNRDFGGNKNTNSLVNKGNAERGVKTVNGRKILYHGVNADNLGYKKGTQERADFIKASTADNLKIHKTDEPTREGKAENYINMKGSPNKLIGDTMDPYGQPQRGNRGFTFNEKGIAPGILGNQASMGVQNEIYGGGQAQVAAEQLAAEQLQAPLLSKGHADDYEGHTHRKKGKSYEVGESIDETDFESLNTSLNAYDRGEIQKDKKSQFIVTKNTDFNPVETDTIRPKNGNQFKMGWGDAERNISTNPKYPRSN